ncbi:hypothetical protein D777_02011 [Marinobacter nitratireducens]|uniref:Glycosyltransferase n=1 Tax=Marinobacter nitratireducens TaxID=1137280 RepID=A0A072N374_9GAMM|nr:glycosyltransferase [Marinobacter nitratireducens]KEF31662.1 hypothetical protein D777_02011 [Marinobacter nitratireducens]
MKIVLFLPSLRGGGAEKSAVLLANAFSERGHDVLLVLAKNEGVYGSIVSDSVKVIDLESPKVSGALFKLARLLYRLKPDILLSFMNYANIVCWLAWLASGKAGRFFPSERTVTSEAISLSSALKEYVFRKCIRLAYNQSEKVICISNRICDDLTENFGVSPSKVVTIYNPIVNAAVLDAAREPVNCEWFADSNEFCIVSAGRLHPDKDFELLLRAFSEVSRRRSAKLIILGEGEEKGNLINLSHELGISDSVRFVGFQQNPFKFYDKADLFVLCSKYEGFGNVLVEAMACGTRVIARKGSGGPDEIIDSERTGGLFGDDAELIQLILSEIDHPAKRHAGMERAERFSVTEIADQYLAEFEGAQTILNDR